MNSKTAQRGLLFGQHGNMDSSTISGKDEHRTPGWKSFLSDLEDNFSASDCSDDNDSDNNSCISGNGGDIVKAATEGITLPSAIPKYETSTSDFAGATNASAISVPKESILVDDNTDHDPVVSTKTPSFCRGGSDVIAAEGAVSLSLTYNHSDSKEIALSSSTRHFELPTSISLVKWIAWQKDKQHKDSTAAVFGSGAAPDQGVVSKDYLETCLTIALSLAKKLETRDTSSFNADQVAIDRVIVTDTKAGVADFASSSGDVILESPGIENQKAILHGFGRILFQLFMQGTEPPIMSHQHDSAPEVSTR